MKGTGGEEFRLMIRSIRHYLADVGAALLTVVAAGLLVFAAVLVLFL
jgi:hypothetical protein